MDAKRDDGKAYSIAYVSAAKTEKPKKIYSFTATSGRLAQNAHEDIALEETFPAGDYKVGPVRATGPSGMPQIYNVMIDAYYNNGSTMTFVKQLSPGNKVNTLKGQFNVIRITNLEESSYTYTSVTVTATSTTEL
jgi:hypothetical protein